MSRLTDASVTTHHRVFLLIGAAIDIVFTSLPMLSVPPFVDHALCAWSSKGTCLCCLTYSRLILTCIPQVHSRGMPGFGAGRARCRGTSCPGMPVSFTVAHYRLVSYRTLNSLGNYTNILCGFSQVPSSMHTCETAGAVDAVPTLACCQPRLIVRPSFGHTLS